jgi:hypothetical protein
MATIMARTRKVARPETVVNTNISDFTTAVDTFVDEVEHGGIADPVEASVVLVNTTLDALSRIYGVRGHNHPEIREVIALLETGRNKLLPLARDRDRRGKYGSSDL